MVVTIFGVLFFLIAYAESSQSFVIEGNSNKLYDLDWQCDTICLGSGGKASFDRKNKICKCSVDKNTDDVDVRIMQKNAENMGLQIITCKDFQNLQKREIPGIENQELVGIKMVPKFDLKNFKSHIHTGKFKKPRLEPKKRFEFPTAKKAMSITSESDVKHRLKEIQDKLKERLESMTWKLPKLKQRSAFRGASGKPLFDLKNSKKTETVNWKSKLNNVVGHPTQIKTNANSDSETSSNKIPTHQNVTPNTEKSLTPFGEKSTKKLLNGSTSASNFQNFPYKGKNYFKHEIITQSPDLYNRSEDDDNEEN